MLKPYPYAVAALAALSLSVAVQAADQPAERPAGQAALEQKLARQERPTAIFVTGAGVDSSYGAAAGYADADRRIALTPETPLRIASNTKPFTAATVLRLWEKGLIDLDGPIAPLINPTLNALLVADGYDTGTITVRHLLSHSAGLYDHGGDPRFSATLFGQPDRQWTREALVRLSVSYADPQSAPGTEFRYSDTGYILLGDIVERITGKEIGTAVRDELGLDGLGLTSTWWEIMEEAPAGAPARARQFIAEKEATDIHASMDLYGGGGLVMSARDLALFTAALFEGRIFERAETLEEMLRPGRHKGGDTYRLGMFAKTTSGQTLYWHSGFWGTIAYYSPANRRAVAGVTTNQDGFRAMVPLVEALAQGDRLEGR